MTQAVLQTWKKRLLAIRDRLDRDRSGLKDEALNPAGGEASGSLSDLPLHLADLGSHVFEEEFSLALVGREEQLLAEIDDALARMGEGTYGRCEGCRRKIGRARLTALPYTRFCVACARTLQGQAAR